MTAPTKTPRYDELMSNEVNRNDLAAWQSTVHALELELAAARAEADELARQVGLEVWHIGATLRRPDMRPIIARVRAEMEKERGK